MSSSLLRVFNCVKQMPEEIEDFNFSLFFPAAICVDSKNRRKVQQNQWWVWSDDEKELASASKYTWPMK